MSESFGSDLVEPEEPQVPLSSEDELRRKDIMAPFATRRTATLHHVEAQLAIRLEELPPFNPKKAPEEDVRIAMIQEVMSTVQAAAKDKGWSLSLHPGIPKHLPDAEPEGESPEAHHARTRALREKLAAAGVSGAHELEHLPAGWTRVLEQAGAGILARLSLPDAGRLRIIQAKEKFGTLRFYVSAEGSDAFTADIFEIARWAENATEDRCCVTGKPGSLDMAGWVLTLCPEMKALRLADREAFSDRIYPPPPPEPSAQAPDGI